MKVVYLASYPKSGNTWLRFLLHAAFFGVPTSSLDVARRIPDSHRPDIAPLEPADLGSELAPGPMQFIKHTRLPSPLLPHWAEAAGAIIIIRDPRAVMCSGMHYRQMNAEPVPPHAYARAFLQYSSDPDWLLRGFGTVAQHTHAWQTVRFPVLMLRYEDLRVNTLGALQSVVEFLRLKSPPPIEDLRRAVEVASFENMRAMEKREKTAGAANIFSGSPDSTRKGLYFVNKGNTTPQLDEIAPGLEQAFSKAFGPYLESTGYQHSRSTPCAESC